MTLVDRLRRAVSCAQRHSDYAMAEIYSTILKRVQAVGSANPLLDIICQLERMSEDYDKCGYSVRALQLVQRIQGLYRFLGVPYMQAVKNETDDFIESTPVHTRESLREHLHAVFVGYEAAVDEVLEKIPESSFRPSKRSVK